MFFGLLGADAILLTIEWPFTERAVIRSLEQASSAPVEIQRFRTVYFPRPGCIAEGVVIHHTGEAPNPPLITISKLTVESDYWRLFWLSKTLKSIHTDGMHVRIRASKAPDPPRSDPPGGNGQLGSSFSVDVLVADGTVIDFASKQAGAPPFRISAKHTQLAPVSGSRAVNFETDLRLPTPPADVHSQGRLGPWNQRDPFATAVSGSYTLRHGDLSFTGGVAGMLNSQGTYRGPLRQLEVIGSVASPDFRVVSAKHPVGLTARFLATVHGQSGETDLHSVSVQFGHTEVTGAGKVAAQAAGGEGLTTLALAIPHGRIEDVLYLLTESQPPPMKGDLTVHTSVAIPGTPKPFLKKLRMQGSLEIDKGHFTDPSTENSFDRIRDRSRHESTDDSAIALATVKGSAAVAGGVARLSSVEFGDPGVSAQLTGMFNLLSERVDLHGTAHLEAGLGSAATGFKGFLLKVLSPFFKSRKRKGDTVPIKMTGTYGHISIGLDTAAGHGADQDDGNVRAHFHRPRYRRCALKISIWHGRWCIRRG